MIRADFSFLIFTVLLFSYHVEIHGQILDAVQTEKCRLKCREKERQMEIDCLRKCLSVDVKPGKCPSETNTTIPEYERLCLNTCRTDPQCTGVMKCCKHSCGVVCMTPTQLDLVPGLPPIPINVTVRVNESQISSEGIPINVRWHLTNGKKHKQIQYVVQERHSYDKDDDDDNEDSWTEVKRTPHKHITIKNLFKPGLYYQFRVYSINENGTQGASIPSSPFQILPNISNLTPEPPVDFGIGAQSWGNGTLRFLLVWKKPPSLVPIHRYKLTWSMLKNDTLFQHNKYLVGNMDHFWLNNILPKTEYFFELLAMVKFDDKKIPGKAARIVIRTHERPPPKKRRKIKPSEINVKYKDSINNVQVNKLYWVQDNLYAYVVWEPIANNATTNYSITWAPNTSCQENKAWYVAKTNVTQFEIYDLMSGCDYKISVKAIHDQTLFIGNASLPLLKCVRKNRKNRKIRKDYNFLGMDVPQSNENKPVEVVECPLPVI